ncbi:MAG: DoxX family protein [Gemmatimonadales bacterium]
MRRIVPVNPDLALLVLRVLLAAVMLAHGLSKISNFSGIVGGFGGMGVPAPALAATYATVAEVGGGVLILLGVAVDIAGLLIAIDMLGAIVFVHFKNGFTGQGGWEFPAAMLSIAVALTLTGPGAYSVGGRK